MFRRTTRTVLLPVLAGGLALFAAACEKQIPTAVRIIGVANSTLTPTTDVDVLVGFTSPPGAAEIARIDSVGGRVTRTYKYVNALAATIPDGQRSVLAAAPGVEYVEYDLALDPLGGKQITDWGVSKIEAPAAWALGYRGQNVKVGIFDSGIDVDHPDLVVVGGIDLVGDGNGLDDCNGHGTHVAGIVGATNNGNHTVGVAPRSQLYSMRFANCAWGGATISKMITGIEWAVDNGMDVVNMSFGFNLGTALTGGIVASPLPPGSTSIPPSRASEDAFNAAYARGVLFIGASGNSSTPWVSYPAAFASVVAVGATDDADLIASFSETGTEQELTAPGVNILASYVVGQGVSTTLTVDSDDGRELEAIPLAFAGMTTARGITAPAVYAGFGTAADFAAVNCVRNIAVVMRGGPTFAQKAEAAMNAGCAALVIHNHTPGNFNGTLGTATAPDGRAWIPVVSTTLEEGLYLRDQIQSRPTTLTLINAFGNLAVLSGTSMASPHAAGVAALVLSKNPGLSPDEVRAALRASSNDLGTPGWDPVFGYGRINARRAVEQTP